VITRAELAALIDHTLLKPEATPAEVEALCVEAAELEVAAACVSPTMVPVVSAFPGRRFAVCTVIGFPSGAHVTGVKAAEATWAHAEGATELDLVVNLGQVKDHDWGGVEDEIADVRSAVSGTLKVIVESAALSPDELESVCRAAIDGGADFLKTSTGLHPTGGATVEAVTILAAAAGGAGRPVGVKASGGIRDTTTALAMLDAGATRLGCSASRAILDGLAGLAGRDPHG
jgi:deoxyribose-phosphate aldolase